jgi:hypothetical protein
MLDDLGVSGLQAVATSSNSSALYGVGSGLIEFVINPSGEAVRMGGNGYGALLPAELSHISPASLVLSAREQL